MRISQIMKYKVVPSELSLELLVFYDLKVGTRKVIITDLKKVVNLAGFKGNPIFKNPF